VVHAITEGNRVNLKGDGSRQRHHLSAVARRVGFGSGELNGSELRSRRARAYPVSIRLAFVNRENRTLQFPRQTLRRGRRKILAFVDGRCETKNEQMLAGPKAAATCGKVLLLPHLQLSAGQLRRRGEPLADQRGAATAPR
jgi:hypothetical protein